MPLRPDKLGDFLNAAYSLDLDDQRWLIEIMKKGRAVSGERGPANGAIYDASDVTAFRALNVGFHDASPQAVQMLRAGLACITPHLVVRTFRSILAGRFGAMKVPEMRPMIEGFAGVGYGDAIHVNGLDSSGRGAYFCLWVRGSATLSAGHMAVYRRMAHHLGAAHRCRRRLRDNQAARARIDPTAGAEAILDARRRIIHAEGEAKEASAQAELLEVAKARDLTLGTKAGAQDGLRRWRPLISARWTLVDSFERDGTRYVVARENQSSVGGLSSLSDRERQVIAYLALGQSTKETAYALGISDVTVRVLMGRAAAKLGVCSRAALLEHADVRRLRPRG